MAMMVRLAKCISLRMAFLRLSFFLALIAINGCVGQLKSDPMQGFDIFYNEGIELYAQERWAECKDFMLKALEDYKNYQNQLVQCRLSCEKESKKTDRFLTYDDINARNTFSELAFFEIALKRSDCLRRCKKSTMSGRPESFSSETLQEFEKLQPYDYLQICAYKSGDLNLAASASFTVLLANPDHENMHANVQFYQTLKIESKYFYNMELMKHQDLYVNGIDFYGKQDYITTITFMEDSLAEYYLQLQRCSLLCEGNYDHESLPDFYNALSDHWVHVLRCKHECPAKLATINGAVVDNYLFEHYNYLQFAYYQGKDLTAAAECAATYLLLNPNDETMKQNKAYYLTLGSLTEADFKPRKEAIQFRDSQKMEADMIQYIRTKYKFSDADEDQGREETKPLLPVVDGIVDLDKFRDPSYYSASKKLTEAYGTRDETSIASFQAMVEGIGARLYADEGKAMGSEHFVLDGLLSEEQCADYIKLAEHGKGGQEAGKHSPNVNLQALNSLKVPVIRELVESSTIDLGLAESFFKTSEKMKELMSAYFNLQWPLYVDFLHTTCLKPESGAPDDDYFEHLHADNCIFKPGHACQHKEAARYWREISATLYLNDLEGGDLVFINAEDGNITWKLSPKCGRLVVFNSSIVHGVEAFTDSRCLIDMWTTLDPHHADRDIDHTKAAINALKVLDNNAALKEYLDDTGMKLNMTEHELNGPNRFAVDHIMTDEECDILVQLANVGGITGDGYQHGRLTTVDTENERYAGLTVAKAGELASEGKVDKRWVELFIEKGRNVKELTRRFFKVDQPLYFDYTHLVCRTSLHDKDKVRTDLSHPVHSDNCIIQKDHSCKKAPPAYTQRDYSALLYLNSNYSGGQFIFTHTNMTIQSVVKPYCGMAVGFDAGIYHGVMPVTAGQRCALAMWFTLDENYDEQGYHSTEKLLKNIEKAVGPPLNPVSHGGEL